MLGKTKWLLATSLVASLAFVVPVEAASKKAPTAKAPTNQELLERIEKLEADLAKQKADARSTKAQVIDLAAQAKDVSVDFKDSRPTFKTGDGRFSLSLRARVQADYGQFFQTDQNDVARGKKITSAGTAFNNMGDLSSGSLIRRAYLGIEGKAFKDFWYEFRLNLGGGGGVENGDPLVNIARVAYVGIPHFRINAGVIQPIYTFGDTVSSGQLMFIEKPEIVNVATGVFGGGDSRKGVELTFQKDGMFYNGDNLI
jgi:phosphate-selective porin OprO/OprP